jgi:hypothetical protein
MWQILGMILNKQICHVIPDEMPNRPQVVAPREGPHALISTDVHARATQPGAAHPAPLRCRGSVARQ